MIRIEWIKSVLIVTVFREGIRKIDRKQFTESNWSKGRLIERKVYRTENLSNGKFIERKNYRTENSSFIEWKIHRAENSSNGKFIERKIYRTAIDRMENSSNGKFIEQQLIERKIDRTDGIILSSGWIFSILIDLWRRKEIRTGKISHEGKWLSPLTKSTTIGSDNTHWYREATSWMQLPVASS